MKDFKYKKKFNEPYLTAKDWERIRSISDNPSANHQKFKAIVTFISKNCKQEICITIYGETKEKVQSTAKEHLDAFQTSDASWTISDIQWKRESEDTQDDLI